MSKGETEYEVQKIGTPDWGHAVMIVEHDNGDVDTLFAGFTGIGLQALRYSEDGWLDVKNEYPPDSYYDENWNVIDQGSAPWSNEMKYFNVLLSRLILHPMETMVWPYGVKRMLDGRKTIST